MNGPSKKLLCKTNLQHVLKYNINVLLLVNVCDEWLAIHQIKGAVTSNQAYGKYKPPPCLSNRSRMKIGEKHCRIKVFVLTY